MGKITPRAAKRNPWARARLFREYVKTRLNELPPGSGGMKLYDLAAAFDEENGTRLAGSTNLTPMIDPLVRDGRVRRIDNGRYASGKDKAGYPADFRGFLVRYAGEHGRITLDDVIDAFRKSHRYLTNLGENGAERVAKGVVKDGILKKAGTRRYMHSSFSARK